MATPIKPLPRPAPKPAAIVAPKPTEPTALAAPGQFDEELAAFARDEAAAQPLAAGVFISTQSGIISIGGQEFDELQMIVLDHIFENSFYTPGFNPDTPKNPICFALARDRAILAPHPDSEQPQSPTCATCPQNQWGTAVDPQTGQPRRGKACQNRRRLAVISPNGLTPEGIPDAEPMYYKTPVTSSKNWDNYVHFVESAYKKPTFVLLTKMSTRPDKKTQYQVLFQPESIVDATLIPSLIERHKQFKAADTIMFPYQSNAAVETAPEAEPAPAPAPRPLPRKRF